MKRAKLFYKVARMAIAAGREIALEAGEQRGENRVLNGTIQDSHNDSRTLTLRVFAPEAQGDGEEASL